MLASCSMGDSLVEGPSVVSLGSLLQRQVADSLRWERVQGHSFESQAVGAGRPLRCQVLSPCGPSSSRRLERASLERCRCRVRERESRGRRPQSQSQSQSHGQPTYERNRLQHSPVTERVAGT